MIIRKLLPILLFVAVPLAAQSTLPVKWEELTAGDFVSAIERSRQTCMLPLGIIEKHGPHLPLGTDLFNVRHAAMEAASQEYAVVFPEVYVGQIFEAKHQPGTVSYSLPLQLQFLQETTDEMARNGCKRILIVNGHGGNEHLLPLFAQSQLASRHDYVVYVYSLGATEQATGRPEMKSSFDLHGGEAETSHVLIARPDLVRMDRASSESGADRDRLKDLPSSLYTGIWWYAKFPDHYAGDASAANTVLGGFDMTTWSAGIVTALRAIKADSCALVLQNEFYDRARDPLHSPPARDSGKCNSGK